MGKIARIIWYSLVVILVIVFLIMIGFLNVNVASIFGLGLGILLAIAAVIGIVVSSVLYIIDNPKSAVNMLVGAGVILLISIIGYLVAPGTITDHHLKYGLESVSGSKMVDMGIYLTIALGVIAVVSILVSEAMALFKN